MKFTIEILRISDRQKVRLLHRTAVEATSPERARVAAATLLDSWRKRRANAARVRDEKGEKIYDLSHAEDVGPDARQNPLGC